MVKGGFWYENMGHPVPSQFSMFENSRVERPRGSSSISHPGLLRGRPPGARAGRGAGARGCVGGRVGGVQGHRPGKEKMPCMPPEGWDQQALGVEVGWVAVWAGPNPAGSARRVLSLRSCH